MDELEELRIELNRVLTELIGENPDLEALTDRLLRSPREESREPLIITGDTGPAIAPERADVASLWPQDR